MDLQAELKKNKRQFESGEINENEYNQRQKIILNKWSDEPKMTKKTSRGKYIRNKDTYIITLIVLCAYLNCSKCNSR